MFSALLKILAMIPLCCAGVLACAANQSAQEAQDPMWSMLIDTSAPEFSTHVGVLRERMTRCRAGQAVLYRDTGMTKVIVEPPKHRICRWNISIETEGHKASFVCSPPVGSSPLPTSFSLPPQRLSSPGCAVSQRGSGQSPTPREDRVPKV